MNSCTWSSGDDYTGLDGCSILITGADGMLGRAFSEALAQVAPTARVLACARSALDVTDSAQVMSMVIARPDIILHCAGVTNADVCEREPQETWRVHLGGTQQVVRLANECGARVFYPQSVFVFDGKELPVTEYTTPAPGLEYGRAKLAAERLVLESVPHALVVRLAGFFGGDDKDKNFVGLFARTIERLRAEGRSSVDVGDRVWQPTYTLDHARNVLLLLSQGRTGVYNMGSVDAEQIPAQVPFFEVAREMVSALRLDRKVRVNAAAAEPFSAAEAARRPMRMVTANARLDAEGLNRQRDWRVALREYLARPYFDRLRADEQLHAAV